MGRIRKLYRAGTVFCVLRGVIGKPQKVSFWTVWAGLEGVPGLGSQGPSKPGKVRFPASPGQDAGNRGLGQGPQTRPQGGLPDAQKGGPQTPTFGPQAHYRPDGLLGPIPEPRFRDRSQGVLPKTGSGLETSVLDTQVWGARPKPERGVRN